MYCNQCGKSVSGDERFCSGCGMPVGVPPQGAFPPPPQTQHPHGMQQPQGNGMAIAGFVCAFVFAILGIIFSAIGLSRASSRGGAGKGLAIAGLVISILNMILAMIFYEQILGTGTGTNPWT